MSTSQTHSSDFRVHAGTEPTPSCWRMVFEEVGPIGISSSSDLQTRRHLCKCLSKLASWIGKQTLLGFGELFFGRSHTLNRTRTVHENSSHCADWSVTTPRTSNHVYLSVSHACNYVTVSVHMAKCFSILGWLSDDVKGSGSHRISQQSNSECGGSYRFRVLRVLFPKEANQTRCLACCFPFQPYWSGHFCHTQSTQKSCTTLQVVLFIFSCPFFFWCTTYRKWAVLFF